ncbi:Stk1 family PASTA domain-containing Ser/Thr kinase [Motilibacter deserti]|uniref:non-specific serine/threonine protein kinase n=1 Tax=Motilibacter deserti TaxID=2714956 RepID=A0ABX0GR63_9ACTN|nr:Stk1 family PASTA domain-containing Ser/Thr kinase [Motilibacter deserti]
MDTTVLDPLLGQVVDGRYRVVSRVAAGGMAVVYEAVDERLDRTIALKVMHPWLATEAEAVNRFIREAKSAARLSHPGVVSVFDQGRDGDRVWIAMEYVDGRNLRALLRDRGRLGAAEALDLIADVLAALAAAHRAGLVHRDMKPENVLIADDGRVKVADFGLARAATAASSTRTDAILGSVSYLAPELLERGVADQRADVYAVGILLFECLTGGRPFDGETPIQVAYRHVHEDVPAPSSRVAGVPAAVDALVARATDRDPDGRPDDAGALLAGLQAVRDSLGPADEPTELVRRGGPEPAPTRPGPRPSPPRSGPAHLRSESTSRQPVQRGAQPRRRRAVRRRRALLGAVVAVVLLGAGLFWYAGPLRWTSAPTLAGLTESVAAQRAEQAGLDLDVRREWSETVAAGEVVKASPAAGERVLRDGTVTVVVSRGPEMIRIPVVSGKAPAAATAAIEQAKLVVGRSVNKYDEKVPQGQVLGTDPAAGESLRVNRPVTLVVSRGPKPVPVPAVEGKPAAEAEKALTDAGLTVKTTEAYSESVAKGAVVSQSVAAGKGLKRGTQVGLVVSLGPPLVQVPDVIDDKVSEAVEKLEAAGFRVERRGTSILGRVLGQNPDRGSSAPKGSTITIITV